MECYLITFYRNRKCTIESKYYRQFPNTTDLNEWCEATNEENRYYGYTHKTIPLIAYLENTK